MLHVVSEKSEKLVPDWVNSPRINIKIVSALLVFMCLMCKYGNKLNKTSFTLKSSVSFKNETLQEKPSG